MNEEHDIWGQEQERRKDTIAGLYVRGSLPKL